MPASYKLGEIARLIDANLKGDPHRSINGIMTLQSATSGQISFLDNKRYLKYLSQTQASAVILRPEYAANSPCDSLITPDPYLAFAKIAKLFEVPRCVSVGIHPTAIIGEKCQIHPSASIGAFCLIGNQAFIAEGVVIASGCQLGEGISIAANTRLEPNVTLYANTVIGARVIIHSGSVLGSDGFGLAKEKEVWVKIPQLGKVIIGDDVEIGANVTIDRGALEDTYIGKGVKLDNQIQIGHNVHIGDNTAIAGCTGIAGSTHIGKNCMIGGGVCINGHIQITDNVIISGMSSVVHSIHTPGIYSSTASAQKQREWQKNSARFRQLDNIVKRFKKVESFLKKETKKNE